MVFKTKKDLIILGAAGVFFLFSSLFLSYISPTYSSPDETANAFFAKNLATNGHLFFPEPLNMVLGDVLFPRSIISLSARLLPTGFLGLPILLGGLIKIFGVWSLPIWTPLFALLAIFAWYGIIKKIFNGQIALFSSLLIMFFPAWWYWSARPLMPNVIFVCFLIFGVFFLVVKPVFFLKNKFGWLDLILASGCFAFAVWLRTFEVFWLGFSLLVGWFFWRKFFSWKSIGLFLVSFIVAIVPFLVLNNSLYGSPFRTGYTAMNSGIVPEDNIIESSVIETVVKNESLFSKIINTVAPFDLHLQTTIKHFEDYFLFMFWWLVILAVFGLFFIWPHKSNAPQKRLVVWTYLFLSGLTILWLVSIYGSWTIHDNPDLSVTIGNSYTRYWLPCFVLLSPLIAVAIIKPLSFVRFNKLRIVITALVFLALIGGNFYTVFFSSNDALWPMRVRLARAAEIRGRVLTLTEVDAVIIVDRADKLFFPDRRVIYPLRDEKTYALMLQIVALVPLYYYGITLPQADIDYLNGDKLKAMGLQIDFVENFGEESLYKIYSNK
jgi:hypothetical protein